MYTYLVADYPEIEDDIRGVFGVDEEILPSKVINSISNLPAAELEISGKFTVELTTLTGSNLLKARLAIVYTAAANCLPSVKLAILQEESDSKTIARRFKDALTLSADELLQKAGRLVLEVNKAIAASSSSVSLLDFYSPSVDVVTGANNA